MAQAEQWVRGGQARVGDTAVTHAPGSHPANPAQRPHASGPYRPHPANPAEKERERGDYELRSTDTSVADVAAVAAVTAGGAAGVDPELRLDDLLVVDYARLDVFPRRIL